MKSTLLKATERDPTCDERLPHYWEVFLEKITQLDVCIIYPAVEFARQLKKELLTKDIVPSKVTPNTITGAIDLTMIINPTF